LEGRSQAINLTAQIETGVEPAIIAALSNGSQKLQPVICPIGNGHKPQRERLHPFPSRFAADK